MDEGHDQHCIGEALGTIEETILPGISSLLDGLLDCAALARPGIDAEAHADELRALARQIGDLNLLVMAVVPERQPAQPLRMSA